MKNARLNDNSHISGSSESEINVNKLLKSNNSLRRFNNDNNEEAEKSYRKPIRDSSKYNSAQDNDRCTIKFLNKTIKNNECPKIIQNKEAFDPSFNTPNKTFKMSQHVFKISLNPFPSHINTKKTSSISQPSNMILLKNQTSKKIKLIPGGKIGNIYYEKRKRLLFDNEDLNEKNIFNKKGKKDLSLEKKLDNKNILPDYVVKKFPIIASTQGLSLSNNKDSSEKINFSKTEAVSFFIKNKKQIGRIGNNKDEENINIDEELIKKEIYYNRLNYLKNLEKKPENINEKEIISHCYIQKKLVTDKKPLNVYMPPGLIKSPNSEEFCKFNLVDELSNDPLNSPLITKEKVPIDQEENKNKSINENKRLMTPRMLITKKNTPEIKQKVLNDFIEKLKHRKIYVILDGSAVLNLNIVPGKFIDIPTVRYMEEIKTKKERISILSKFIEDCRNVFGLNVKIKNIYDHQGKPIYDVANISEESKYIYVSTNEIFVGISIIFYNETTNKLLESKLSVFENREIIAKQIAPKFKSDYYNSLEKSNRNKNKLRNQKKCISEEICQKLNSLCSFEEYTCNQKPQDKKRNYSFDSGHYISKKYLEDERINAKKNNLTLIFTEYKLGDNQRNNKNKIPNDYNKRIRIILSERYHSDDEKEKKRADKFLIENYSDSYKLWIYFLDYLSDKNKYFIKNKIIQTLQKSKEKKEKNYSFLRKLEEEEKKSKLLLKSENTNQSPFENGYKNKEKVEDEIIDLIDNFNKTIDKKINSLENYIRKKKLRKNNILIPDCPDKITLRLKKEMISRTKLLMKNFLLGFQLFRLSKDQVGDYMLQKQDDKKDLKYVSKNKKKHDNVYYDLTKQVNRSLPSLFSFNIPKILEKYKNFSRSELYELFVQYKVIMKISIALNKDRSIAKKGVDFSAFYKGVPQMSNESNEIAYKIFDVINESKTNYLSLDEFLRGMSIIKSEDISDKIDMFFKIIDSDGNGQLSWDEVYEISLMSLKRSLVIEEEKGEDLIKELAEYFADLIFKLVEVDKDEEIPLPKIREKIDHGGEEAKYLEMFCCADNFKK